jgi:hypothetical protein
LTKQNKTKQTMVRVCSLLVLASTLCASELPPMPRPEGPGTTIVFMHGEGNYPCIRIPSIINAGALIEFAECRCIVGDGFEPAAAPVRSKSTSNVTHDICSKKSQDRW